MGSATEEEFKEKLLWNVKREVSASYVNEQLDTLINMEDRCVRQCSRLALIPCVYCTAVMASRLPSFCAFMIGEVCYYYCDAIHRPDLNSTVFEFYCTLLNDVFSSFPSSFTPLQFKGE